MRESRPRGGRRSSPTAAPSIPAASWGYGTRDGPALWGTLDEAFSACALGAEQSPIDLTGARNVDLAPVEFDYGRTRLIVENTGHTIQMTPQTGSGIMLDGARYDLVQFHFHRRSEHLVDGTRFPLEMHLVHRNGDNGVAVVGILFVEGEANEALAPAWSHLPPVPGTSREALEAFDVASLLPAGRTTWRYRGSLTTPPCTEGVAWVIPVEPLSMSASQIAAFAALYPHNCRPVHPLGERVLYRG